MIVQITKDNFQEKILNSNLRSVVEFGEDWCRACRTMRPYFEKLSEEFEGKAIIAAVKVESEIDLAMDFHIMTIPTVLVFENGEVIDKKTGLMTEENIRDLLKK